MPHKTQVNTDHHMLPQTGEDERSYIAVIIGFIVSTISFFGIYRKKN
ncbi:LPXTG cell wall anchor domain-containing protein [Pediococcus argentinicus]|nr:LPXTG cell wall anchor domain-containing protein [Pediococcus argentinicus]